MPRLRVVVLIALLFAGCAGSQTTQSESAGGTADTLVQACAAGRPEDSLEVLTPAAREAFAKAPSVLEGCLQVLGVRFPGVPRAEIAAKLSAIRVISVHANELSATAELRTSDGDRSRVELEKSRGIWSVAHSATRASQ